MFKVTITPEWQLEPLSTRAVLPKLLPLLVHLDEAGTLRAACERTGLSYRYAWGLLREGEQAFGVPLVRSVRGRGAVLTVLGQKLVWADRRVRARLTPMLESLASELEVEIGRALSQAQGLLRLQASHGFAVETLRRWFVKQQLPLELRYCTSDEAVAALSAQWCDLAGFHVPIGEFEAPMLAHYQRWLDPQQHRLIVLASRRQGLMVAPGNPQRINELEDLCRPTLRFVNRQVGSGTRRLFEALLQHRGIDPATVNGHDSAEFTHAAVAAYVASGMADVGFGVETPARRFGLQFIPMVSERYFLLCRAQALPAEHMQAVIAQLRSAEFRSEIDALPGYDALESGTVLTLAEAFGGKFHERSGSDGGDGAAISSPASTAAAPR